MGLLCFTVDVWSGIKVSLEFGAFTDSKSTDNLVMCLRYF